MKWIVKEVEISTARGRAPLARKGKPLWSVPNNLHYVLGNMGVPNEILRTPLPAEGPRALLRYVQPPN